MVELLIATANPHKAREISAVLPGLPLRYLTLADFPGFALPEETGATLEANAALKAESAAAYSGKWTLADDTGLEVDALGGAPGVFSARYGGGERDYSANNARLLRELSGVAPERRTARFRCVVALAFPGRRTILEEGRLEGAIATSPSGANGFGYDPLFIVKEAGKTLAELSSDEKNSLSHRFRAIAKMSRHLRGLAAV